MKDKSRRRAGLYSIIVFSIILFLTIIDLVVGTIMVAKTSFNVAWTNYVSSFNNLIASYGFLKILLTIFRYSSLTFYLSSIITSCTAVIIINLVLSLLMLAIAITGIVNSAKNIRSRGLFNSKKPPTTNIILLLAILPTNLFKVIMQTIDIVKALNTVSFSVIALTFFIYYLLVIILATLVTLSLIYGFKCLSGSTSSVFLASSSFYTSIYEQPEINVVKEKKDETKNDVKPQQETKPESPKSRRLIENIMKLEKLKANGQLSDIEYTKLKQKLIKEYEG